MADKRYNVSIESALDADIEHMATTLGISKADVMHRALMLLKQAIEADEVKLTKNGEDQVVLVK